MSLQKTAILLFSRTATDEADIKTFNQKVGKKGNVAISKELISKSKITAQKTNLPFYTSYSTDQEGDTFGERLANSIESIYQKGYEKVIVIGNDCPNITTAQLTEVNRKLVSEDVILGPTSHGGTYLIGICKDAYSRDLFIKLAWETPQLQESFKKAYSSINWLVFLQDINHGDDLEKYLQSYQNTFTLIIAIILGKRIRQYNIQHTAVKKADFLSFYTGPFRAPPAISLSY